MKVHLLASDKILQEPCFTGILRFKAGPRMEYVAKNLQNNKVIRPLLTFYRDRPVT
jgi:hypothetical protein